MRMRLSFDSNRDAHNRKYTYQSIVYCWRSDITLVGIETQNFFYLSTGRYHLRSAQHFEGASGSFCFALSLQQPDMQHPPAASLALKNDTNLHLISLGMVEFLKSKDVLIPINSQETSTAVFFFFFFLFFMLRGFAYTTFSNCESIFIVCYVKYFLSIRVSGWKKFTMVRRVNSMIPFGTITVYLYGRRARRLTLIMFTGWLSPSEASSFLKASLGRKLG